jgi:putative transposase
MARNYYSEINLHFVRHTKNNAALLVPAVEAIAHRVIRKRLVDCDGVFVHAIGGTDDHIHVAVTVLPTITPSEFIGQIKGGSAHGINQQAGGPGKVLEWQAGYGVVSSGTRDQKWVVKYIRNQREHHRQQKIFDRLERITCSDDATFIAGAEGS